MHPVPVGLQRLEAMWDGNVLTLMYSALNGSCQSAITLLSLTAFSTALKSLFPYSLSASFPVWSGKTWTLFLPVCSFINTVILSYRQAAQHTWKCALKVPGDTMYKMNSNQTHQRFHFSCCFACPLLPSAIPGQHSKDLSMIPAK